MCRRAECPVVQAQLGQLLARLELEITSNIIAFDWGNITGRIGLVCRTPSRNKQSTTRKLDAIFGYA